MPKYTSISILYNPISTGPSKEMAYELKRNLDKQLSRQAVKVMPTEYVGHGEELAYKLAKKTKHPLIISSSGDGGYHEVINGAMRAKHEGADPVTGILPAGNANDHFHNLHDEEIVKAIVAGSEQTIDLLKFSYEDKTRYAHSYIGVGLTPQAGKELNKHSLNLLVEAWIVIKVLLFLKPIRLKVRDSYRTYDSLIFSNVAKMSKVLSISDIASAQDGKFEVTAFRRRNKLRLIARLLKASTRGLKSTYQTGRYEFETTMRTLVQLDGELITLPKNCKASVTIEPATLRCII